MNDRALWFVRLSGWPVFLTVVAIVLLFMLILSVVLNWLSSRSVVQNFVIAFLALALIAVGGLAIVTFMTRG